MLRQQIGDEMRLAMKARDTVKVNTLRLVMTAIKNAEVERQHDLSDEEVLEVLAREAKKRRESIEAFELANRTDLVVKEQGELAVIESYLPENLSDDEIARLVDEAITEAGATSPRQMGEVMKVLMPRVRGRADGAEVSALVKERLGA